MLFATILTQVLSRTTNLLPSLKTSKVDAKVIQNQILPVAACFAISLITSNKAYVYLSVSFIQVHISFSVTWYRSAKGLMLIGPVVCTAIL